MADKQFVDVETDHEYDGIREFDNPLPAWWLWTFAITTVFGVFYWLANHTLPSEGTFEAHAHDMDEYQREMAANAVSEEELITIAQDPAAVAAGREHYVTNCKSCHGEQGEGLIGPNLTDAYWLHGQQPKDIWTTLSFGVTAKGMPAWRATLGDSKINELFAYVSSLKGRNLEGPRGPQGVDAEGNAP